MSNQQNQPQQGRHQEIKLADNIPGAEYANLMQVNFSQDEFLMMFANIAASSGRVVSKVIASPGHVKRIAQVLQESIKKYEEQFGEVKIANAPANQGLGFEERK